MASKIRPFRWLRNNKENPEKFLQSIEWLYQVDYKHDEPEDPVEGQAFRERTLGILFASHLAGRAEDWYDDLEVEDTEWNTLVVRFRDYYRIVPRNPKGRQFDLAMKLADIKQQEDESITSYIERAEAIATKFPGEEFSTGMATVTGMSEPVHQHWIEKECLKKEDFEFGTGKKLVMVSYTRIGQVDLFNKERMTTQQPFGSSHQSIQTQNEMLQQILINQSCTFPAILQTMKAMNNANTHPYSSLPPNNNHPSKPRSYPPRDLSHIKCFTCGEMGHYASLHDREQTPPAGVGVDLPEAVSANMVQVLKDYYQPEEERLLSVPAVQKGRVEKAVRKSRVVVNPEKLQQAAQQHMDAFDEKSEDNDQDESMDELEDIHAPIRAQTPVPVVPTRILQNPDRPQSPASTPLPPTRKTKTGKVQELVQARMPKRGDPIRGMESKPRFEIDKILDTPIVLKIGEFLDCSDVAIKELAYSMQRSTPRYRVKRLPVRETSQQMAARIALYPPPIASTGFDDDELSQPLMVTSWAQGLQMEKTLLDGGSMVESINRELVNKMNPRPRIYKDSRVKISLANDATTTLSEFVRIPVNVQRVETVVRAWLVDVKVYDLLLGVSWMRRVNCIQSYGEGKVTIMGQDLMLREAPTPMTPLSMPAVEFESVDEEWSADQACQELINEQGKAQL